MIFFVLQSLEQASWQEALSAVQAALKNVKGSEIRAIAGKLADAESLIALKEMVNRLGSGDLRSEAGFHDLDADVRSNYLFNSTFQGVDHADAILLIGTNPRIEAPVLNARLRAQATVGVPVAVIGEPVDLTYKYEHLGQGADAVDALTKAGSEWLAKLKDAKNPMIIVGAGTLKREDRDAVLAKIHKLVEKANIVRDDWNGYNVLHDSASRVAALDLGFLPSARARASKTAPKVVFLLGSDDYDEADVPSDAFVIYQGHHGDRGAARADVVLPGAAYTEKTATFVNTEGRVQSTRSAAPVVANARDDWKVLRALSEVLGVTLPYDTLEGVRARLADVAPHMAKRSGHAVESPIWLNGEYFKAHADRLKKASASKEPLQSGVEQFYMTDAISRASKTMAQCIRSRASAGHSS